MAVLTGTAGADSLAGEAGSDTLDGGPGADTMTGGLGDDRYFVDDAGDLIRAEGLQGFSASLPATGNGDSFGAVLSGDGRYLVFESAATGFVAGDTNSARDIFLKDLSTGDIERVSTPGFPGASFLLHSGDAQVSADGRYVVFRSDAQGLVAADTNFSTDVFVLDRQTDAISLVSVTAEGVQGNNTSFEPTVSADGRYVAFSSFATNLPGSDFVGQDVFLKDLTTGGLTREAADAWTPSLSADGKVLAFLSSFSTHVAGDTNLTQDVFVKDLATGTVQRVSTSSSGAQANGASSGAQVSADGRFVVFISDATNLVTGDTNGRNDVFVKDLETGVLVRASIGSDGTQSTRIIDSAAISPDGRFVAFSGALSGQASQVFLKDLSTGLLGRLSSTAAGAEANGASTAPSFSADGRYIVFHTAATDLVAGDTNGKTDVVVATNPWFALGDGTDTVEATLDWTLGPDLENLVLVGTSLAGTGNALLNVISGDAGDDTLDGGLFADTLIGGAGNDTYVLGSVSDRVIEAADGGVDTVHAVNTLATLSDHVEHLVITGEGDFSVSGNALDNHIAGNGGANVLAGGEGADTLAGGDGNDIYLFDGVDAIVEGVNGGADTVRSALSHELGAELESLVLTGSADAAATGNGLDNRLYGNAGANLLDGGEGADTMAGGAGNDTYVVDDAADVVTEGAYQPQGFSRIEQLIPDLPHNLQTDGGDFSADGRYLVFSAVTGAGEGTSLPFNSEAMVKDLWTGQVRVASSAASGVPGGAQSVGPKISADGRYIVFESTSETLVSGDTNDKVDIFRKDMLTGDLERVSVSSSGTQADDLSVRADISADGRWVVFESFASNLVAGDTNGLPDVFVRDMQTGTVTRVSTDAAGAQPDNFSFSASISPDGRYVAFGSLASNLVAGDVNGNADLFLKDLQTGAVRMVALGASGGLEFEDFITDFSGDGRYLAFTPMAGVVGAENADASAYALNLATGGLTPYDVLGNAGSSRPSISHDGSYLVFQYQTHPNGWNDIVVARPDSLTASLVSYAGAPANGGSWGGKISPDGRLISFQSVATNLAPGDEIPIAFLATNAQFQDGGGIDLIRASTHWTLPGDVENLELTGVSLAGWGNGLDNSITGTTGADTLSGSSGADTLAGGEGNDLYRLGDLLDRIVELPGGGFDTMVFSMDGAKFSLASAPHVEAGVLMGESASRLAGTGAANALTGNHRANVLEGLDGGDTLDGLGANDTLLGGAGNDTYLVDLVRPLTPVFIEDRVTEGSNQGVDTLRLRLGGPFEMPAPFTVQLGANLENLDVSQTGSVAMLHLTGNGLANVLTGNAGANSLVGGLGADTLIGGAGNDTYVVDHAAELGFIEEQAEGGIDTLRVGFAVTQAQAIALAGNLQHVENVILAGAGPFNVTGNAAVNVIAGNAAANRLDGGEGADSLAGGAGNDTYVVDGAGDQILDTAGTDTVESNATYSIALAAALENVTLTGEGAIDATGNTLANMLTGNAGANTLTGLAGNDTYVVQNTDDVVVEAPDQGIDLVRSSASFTLGDNVEKLVLVAGDIDGTGNALTNTITGSSGDNVLDGRGGKDVLVGGAGNDTYVVNLVGLAKPILEDRITELANGGTDTLKVRADDLVLAAPFTLLLAANLENLDLSETGTLALHGTGNALENILTGNAAANTLNGGLGSDTYVDSAGNDVYLIAQAGDAVEEGEGSGADTVRVALSGNTYLDLSTKGFLEHVLYTGAGAQVIKGNAAANSLAGAAGADSIEGGAGADTLVGGAGADTLRGGDGDDSYFLDNANDKAIEESTDGNDTVVTTANITLEEGSPIENVTLAGTAASATGNTSDNRLVGNAAANTLNGGGGGDTLDGGPGADVYIVDGGDTVVESIAGAPGGVDMVRSSVSFTLGENFENLILTGGNTDGTGNALVNTITGSTGHNVLDGKGGKDVLTGGAGNDTYLVDLVRNLNAVAVEDKVTELANGGIDTLALRTGDGFTLPGASYAYVLQANFENLDLSAAGAHTINATGNAAANHIVGNDGNNLIIGLAGSDTLEGGGGNDTFVWDAADGRIDGGAGSDTLRLGSALAEFDLRGNETLENLEVLSLVGNGKTLLILDADDVLAMTSGGVLRIVGDVGDTVLKGAGWVTGATESIGGVTYRTFTQGSATLLIDEKVSAPGPAAVPVGDSIPLSGVASIDGLVQGGSWQFPESRVITYSLNINNEIPLRSWTPELEAAVDLAFAEWEKFLDVDFQRVSSGTFYYESTADFSVNVTGDEFGAFTAGIGFFPDPAYADESLADSGETRGTYPRPEGDVFLNVLSLGNDLDPGEFGFFVILHEIGHALGLKHPDDDGGNDRPTFASLGISSSLAHNQTIMWDADPPGGLYARTPMLLDVQAAQHVYGGRDGYHSGDDEFLLLTGSASPSTIWDTGGDDTFMASAGADFTLDLREGHFSGAAANLHLGIAFGTVIENATGSSGKDKLFGNDADNRLDGGAGADTLQGAAGNDTLMSSGGTDSYTGGSGSDAFVIDAGNRWVASVTDFSQGEDRFALGVPYASLFTGDALGGDVIGTKLIYNGATGELYYDADASGLGAAVKVATLATGLTLTADDFTQYS